MHAGGGLFENVPGRALSSKFVIVRSLSVGSFGTDSPCPRRLFSTSGDPCLLSYVSGKMSSTRSDPSCGAKRKDMGDVLVAISHEYVPMESCWALDKFCKSPLSHRHENFSHNQGRRRDIGLEEIDCNRIQVDSLEMSKPQGMGTLTRQKGGGMHGALSKAHQLGLPKGCGILHIPRERSPKRLGGWNGETLPVALRQEDGSNPSVSDLSGGNLQQGIIREYSPRGGGNPLTCWHVDRKGKCPLGETPQGEHQREAYPENPRAVINGVSSGNYPGESSAQAQMRGRGERVTTDEGTEGDVPQVKNTASAPPGGSTTAGGRVQLARPLKMGRAILDNSDASRNAVGTYLLLSSTPTYSVKGKSTVLQRRPHFNELRPGRKQDSRLDQPSEHHDLVCIWNLGHLLRQAFGVELEVCLGVLWRDVVKWARVRDSWSEGSVRFDVVVKVGKARVVLDRVRKEKGWVAREHRSFKEREARRERVGRVGGGRGSQGQTNWKIVSWNINGDTSKKWDLQHLVSSESWGIVGLQETRVWENRWPISIPGMVVFQARGCLREVRQRGVALAVSKEFRSFQVGPIDPKNIWEQVSHQSLGNRAWIFGSVYIPQHLHREECQDCLRRVLGVVQDLKSKFRGAPLVMLGDGNMSLKSLEQWIARSRGLQVLKVAGDRRSFHSARGKPVSVIDQIIVNQQAADLLGSGRVLRRIDGSNHWLVQTTFRQVSFLQERRGEGGQVEKPVGFQRAKINEVRDEIRLSNRWEPLERLYCSVEEGVEVGVKSFVDISVSIASSVGVIGDAGLEGDRARKGKRWRYGRSLKRPLRKSAPERAGKRFKQIWKKDINQPMRNEGILITNPPDVLESWQRHYAKAFLKVVNGIWDAGHIPANLNSIVIVSIPKKGDLTLHDNYRGISLIPVLLKILTSVIIKRIDSKLEERKFFTKSQAGFDKGEECVAQVVALKEIILRRNIKGQKATHVAFIDFKKAYDMVRFEDLVSTPILVQRGVRQGCLASPLFNIFINDIMDVLKGLGVEVLGISDVIAGLLFVESVPQLKEMLKKVHEWAQKWGMACGIDKCKAMVVFGNQDRLKLEVLLIGEERIGVCESYKYLGFEVDSKLSVERMIKERATVGKKVLFGMRHFLVDKRIPTWAKVLAFKALVHPRLTFGAEVIGAYRVGEKWSWVHRTKKWIAKNAPRCQNQGLLVREATWEAWESNHSTEALQFYKKFKLEGSREFFKRAMRYEDVTPEKVCLLILARVGGCLLVRRAVRLGIADHRIGVRCLLCNEEGGHSLFHVLVKCPSLVHVRTRIEGLESLVSKLWLTSAANDEKSRLVLLLGGDIGSRLCLKGMGSARGWVSTRPS
eukprot:Gb_28026 [translate_table: standard]